MEYIYETVFCVFKTPANLSDSESSILKKVSNRNSAIYCPQKVLYNITYCGEMNDKRIN